MKLYPHQARFLAKNPDRALLLWEMSTGKTLAACEWIKKRSGRPTLVVCPKALVGKWERDLKEDGATATVMTRDEIKRSDISPYRVLVLDEAHDYAAPLFSKARSQRATKIYNHVKTYPDTNVLLLSATPIRSSAWNAHSLACYIGRFWPIPKFRQEFEYMTDRYGRMHYELVPDWRKKIRPYIESIADIVLLKDCVDIPQQHQQVIHIPWAKEQEERINQEYLEPAAKWHERHRAENGIEKLKVLKTIVDGYRKVVVIAYYTSQIKQYAAELSKERQVFILQGSTKDQDAIIQAAKEADDCIFFVQASMSAGFDADQFSVMIFASQSFKFVDNIQAQGRILRLHNLHENTYVYLLGGECDEGVYETVLKGFDFHPPAYMS